MKRRARVVYRLTDALRERMLDQLQARLSRAEAALAALDGAFEASGGQSPQAERLKHERERLLTASQDAAERLARLRSLSAGDEVTEGAVEVLTRIAPGDSEERLGEAQIVIQDGVVVEVRNP